jgi:hypothetical protein
MRPTKSAFWSHLLLICILLGGFLPGADSVRAAASSAGIASVPAFPTRSDLAALRAQLPDDPVAAVQALVDMVYGADETKAQTATGELLRRAGLPLVSISGPVIGLPDGLVLRDASIYVELLPDLTQALRRGSFYTPAQLSDLLLEVGLTTEPLDPQAIVAALGQWGKEPGSPLESLVAGATVRALSGRRLQVLYMGADLDTIQFDPLQVMLVLAHATSRAAPLAKPTSWKAPRLGFLMGSMGFPVVALTGWAAEQKGPCDDLAKVMERETQVGDATQEKIKEVLVDELKKGVNEHAVAAFDKGMETYAKGSAVVSTLLLMMGATIDINDNKGGLTHFAHAEGDRSTHVKLKAVAKFNSNIAKQHVACYQLAGIDVPPPGAMVGYQVRWNVSQSIGSGYEGKFLTSISADSHKIGGCGTCFELTGQDGSSTIEMYPPTEKKPNQGYLMAGYVYVTASLDKSDFPFKLSDLLGLKNPGGFAAGKTWDLAISALKRAGLPSQTRTIKVGYHGVDIYVAKGETGLFLLYVTAPVQLDIYTCNGLGGTWHGTGGLGGDTKTILGGLAETLTDTSIPENVKLIVEDFTFTIDPTADENKFDINPALKIYGIMRISQVQIAAHRAVKVGQNVGHPVGEVEVYFNGVPLTLLSFGAGTVYPLYSVPRDPRCPASGQYYENYP